MINAIIMRICCAVLAVLLLGKRERESERGEGWYLKNIGGVLVT